MGALDFGRVSALPPLALLTQALPRLTRHELESVVELLIDRLDAVDGDPDIEANGDELDGTLAEDCFGIDPNQLTGPGCPIAESDCAVDDFGCDEAEEGDLENDTALNMPFPRYGDDQRIVLALAPIKGLVAYQHD